MAKRHFRCNVCNDVHFGMNAPVVCPTCGVKHGYCEIDEYETRFVMHGESGDGNPGEVSRDKERIRMSWKVFASEDRSDAGPDSEFVLNPDTAHVDMVIDGVLANLDEHGAKLCPCRLRDPEGTYERDLELLCPCNFMVQDTWKERGDCWCGLFVKRS